MSGQTLGLARAFEAWEADRGRPIPGLLDPDLRATRRPPAAGEELIGRLVYVAASSNRGRGEETAWAIILRWETGLTIPQLCRLRSTDLRLGSHSRMRCGSAWIELSPSASEAAAWLLSHLSRPPSLLGCSSAALTWRIRRVARRAGIASDPGYPMFRERGDGSNRRPPLQLLEETLETPRELVEPSVARGPRGAVDLLAAVESIVRQIVDLAAIDGSG